MTQNMRDRSVIVNWREMKCTTIVVSHFILIALVTADISFYFYDADEISTENSPKQRRSVENSLKSKKNIRAMLIKMYYFSLCIPRECIVGTWNTFTLHFLYHFFLSFPFSFEIRWDLWAKILQPIQCNNWMNKKCSRSVLEHIFHHYHHLHLFLSLSLYACNNSSNNSYSHCRQIVNIIQIANRYVGRSLIRLELRLHCLFLIQSIVYECEPNSVLPYKFSKINCVLWKSLFEK